MRGDTILTEGHTYTFTLELAKKMALPARRADAASVLVTDAVPAFGDSARACLQGIGFVIELDGAPAGERCSVKLLADRAQRVWTWNVRPDTMTHAQGSTRRLMFSTKSYRNTTYDDFTRAYKVTVLVVPPGWFERLMIFATSAKGLLVEFVAIAAAIAGLVKYVRRKPPDNADDSLQ
ncbi:MAG: hypothetical protein Q8K55_10975 [Gemmatimonadaceae bacterium]|nr:hypothetical protein [Gemmatimonadaceae bacterium]